MSWQKWPEKARSTSKYWQSITVWLHACGVPSPSRTMLHGPHCASTAVARRTTAHVKHESDLERPLKQRHVQGCQGGTPEPSLQPRSRGWSWPLAGQGPDWTVPHLYAPCYTARYLMFCQSPQTKAFAARLAHQISHRNNRLLPSQSPMVPRCALPPRPMPSLGEAAALLIGPLAYKSHGSRLWGWAGKTITASSSPSSSSSIASPLTRQTREVLAAGGQVAEILKAHQ